ncbi:MAG: hypothetical protein ACK5UM_08845 [Pseudomonadota bacterium]|jgi:Tfp pilus assembly protein PilF|nr:hypothetical protein [Rubrivivax sp.]MCA3260227.1 hypothetical protein [Rubrivivax sp.]MCZ8031204.1 hypothetical protein [Rubrivivax sp.]
MHSNSQSHLTRHAALLTLAGLLSACATTGGGMADASQNPLAPALPRTNLAAQVPKEKLTSAARQLALEGLRAMDQQNWRKASDLFNLAVKTDIGNSYLHFLNAFAYQMRATQGEINLLSLAEQGYEMAVQFDESNWLARHSSGLLAMQQREFGKATVRLAEAALYAGDEADVLYDLATAAYYNQDSRTASAALEGLRRLTKDRPDDPQVLRASAIVAASLNDGEEARNYLQRLRAAAAGGEEVRQVEGRVNSWLQAWQQERGGMVKTQFTPPAPSGFPPPGGMQQPGGGFQQPGGFPAPGGLGAPGAPGRGPGQPGFAGGFVEKQMAVVDVTIISTEEDNADSVGINLLDGLRIQFGNPTALTPAFSRTRSVTSDVLSNTVTNNNTVITRLIQVPALTYSLNIANSNAKRNEVLARPTLVALGNQPSTFFSGQDIVGAAVSGGQGSAVQIQKEVGVKLAVTPEFLPDNLIKLNVVAERTFLAIPSASVRFDFRLDTNKTMVNANVVMKFGETLILSGLSERDQSGERNGVPGLQDVPIVQYLFARNLTRDYYKSVLILLTPRRAQYTQRAEADIAAERASMSAEERALAEFEGKYKLWFRPTPNIAEIGKSLDTSQIFREYRTGDIAKSWVRINTNEQRLRSAIKFLYY